MYCHVVSSSGITLILIAPWRAKSTRDIRAPCAPNIMSAKTCLKKLILWAGGRGAVVEDNYYNKLERLSVQARKRNTMLAAPVHVHLQRIREIHDIVI